MAQTFRTDPETGRTVISQDNVVGRQMASGEKIDNRFATNDPRSSYDTMYAPTRPGTGYMSRSEFESLSGMTETNPYGNDGFFSRVFGVDPSKIDYTNTLGTQGIANVKRMAYDRFMNPFAKVDVFNRPTMGASAVRGTTRSGVQPGDLTIFGPAAEGQAEGIGAIIGNALGFNMNPTIIPGFPGSDARSQARQDRDIYSFDVPENMSELVSAALREDATEARDPAAVPEIIDRGIFTTDDDSPSGAVDYNTVSQFPASPGFTRPDDAVLPSVADVIATEPMVTGSVVPSDSTVIQNIGAGDTGGATISRREPLDSITLESLLAQNQEAFDRRMKQRQDDLAAFQLRSEMRAAERKRRDDRIDALLAAAAARNPAPTQESMSRPEPELDPIFSEQVDLLAGLRP